MTWLTRELPGNEPLRRYGGALLPATLGESMGAAFDDPTLSPTALLMRQAAIAEAAGDESPEDAFLTVSPPAPPPSPMVAAEDLNREFAHLGLSFDRPTRRAVAELLAEGKRAERMREDILARGPQGFWPGAARLGASFAAAALDPINVASAFVPVVSQARFAGFVARYGVTGARLAKGAAEGAAGNLMVEPFVFGLTSAQQLDYGMADALVNVGFGGVLGAGLHAGLGRLGDWLARRAPETREAALRTAVAQAAEGRVVDVDPVLRAEAIDLDRTFDAPFDRPSPAVPAARAGGAPESAGRAREAETRRGLLAAPAADDARLPPPEGRTLENYTVREGDKPHIQAVVDDVLTSDPGHRVVVDDPYGPGSTVVAVPASSPSWFQDANKRLKAAGVSPMTRALVETAGRKLVAGEPLGAAEARAAAEILAAARERRAAEARDMAQFRAAREDRAAQAESESLAALARREAEHDALADGDAAAAARADAAPAKTEPGSPPEELDQIAARIEGYRAAGALDQAAEKELAALADLDNEASALGRAAAAAAECLTRI